MLDFVLRFVFGGLLVACMPWIASHFGATVAGLLLLFPAVSLAGLAVIGLDGDATAVGQAALGALMGLPTVAVFLLLTFLATRQGASLPWALTIGMTGWLSTASIFLLLRSQLGGPG